MRTVGIDFASQPRNTALCEIDWDDSPAKVVQVATHVSDDDIREVVLHGQERVLGVDIPFGWPIHFVQFVTAHLNGDTLPRGVSSTQRRLRATDEFIWEICRRQPLSVSTDRIGIPAMRWALLMQEFAVTNRAGDGFVYEVYPAAARLNWGLPLKDNVAALDLIMAECPLTFISPDLHAVVLQSEHAFDALICALSTRAAVLDMTYPPPREMRKLARVEGWIHAPFPGTLDQLCEGGPD